MAWIAVPGLAGKVYEPTDTDRPSKKHPCKTCFSCQWCDESRCQVCREETSEKQDKALTAGCQCECRPTSRDPE